MGSRLLGLTLAAAALLVVLPGADARPAGGGHVVSVEVDTKPFGVTVLRDGSPVVAEAPRHRLHYRLTTGQRYALTDVTSQSGDVYQVATNEPGRTATVTVSTTTTGARIAVALHPTAGVQEIFDAFGAQPDEHFLGGGERPGAVDLRGQILQIKVGPCSYAPIPFFASSAGWGLRLATENEAAFGFAGSTGGTGCRSGPEPACTFGPLPNRTEVCVQGASLDERIYVGSIRRTLADYEADTGVPTVPPPSEFTLIKWRDVSTGPADLLQDIDLLQAAGIPVGWELLDNPWESCKGLLTFDPSVFPDPAGLIGQVHARGVKFMLWISPIVDCQTGYPAGSSLGSADEPILDLRNPAVVAEFQRRLRALVALGVDGFKGDRADEVDLQPVSPVLNNEYPLLYEQAALATLPPGGAAMFRGATVGSQSLVPGIWAGDQEESWAGLQAAIVSGSTAAMSGFPTWGSDIGGYLTPPPLTSDVFERWAELGAVSPIFEVGGAGANATPWTLGTEAMGVLRDSAILHYELYPYFHGLLQAHRPVLRPLAYDYSHDPQSWSSPYELLVGPNLLAAPVTGQGTTPSVYLPPGKWIDLYAGTRITGGTQFTRPTPLTQSPLYVRSGSVIPFNLRTATGSWWGLNELTHPGRAGFLATSGATLALTGQPGDVQIFVPAASMPHTVTIAGHPVPFTWNTGPFPGVVVRTHGPSISGVIAVS